MSRLLLALLAAASVTACATNGDGSSAASSAIDTSGAPQGARPVDRHARAAVEREDMLTQMAFWAGEYQTFPNDLEAAQKFAESLRRGGRADRAAQVAGEALGRFPSDRPLLNTYALAQLAAHKPQEALRPLAVLAQAEPQNWRARNALGAALDQLGRFQEARRAYAEALTLQPNDAGILTNMGVSHLMEGDPEGAEPILRQAVAQPSAPPQARQNLAIALALQGKFSEAEQLERVDLPPAQAQANIAYLRELLNDPRRWGDLGRPG
ncbi:tetratricopeptide repeat protein [Terricaulis sp.]|uniref:tetratricopeptide repeat protein n=1 Tax=Terricaulis sp. TaxID=2768686 RepID=UPI0037831895